MWKVVSIFTVSLVFSLIFHFIIGGNQSLNVDNISVQFSLKDVLLGLLLFSNLIGLFFIIRRQK